MSEVPEDSTLRRHYQQLQEASRSGSGAGTSGGAAASAAPPKPSAPEEKGFIGKLLDKLFGN